MSESITTRQHEFLNGAKDTIPMIVGAIPFGILFGTLGVTSGLSPMATLAMSLLVFAGSSQFIATGLLSTGTGTLIIIFTTFIVNLRHALYSASVAPYMTQFSQRFLLPLGFWLTDETYAVVIRRYQQDDSSLYKRYYHLGSSIAMYVNWQLCTIIGVIAGTQLTGLADLGLDFAMVVTFIGIVVPLIVTRSMLVCAVVAGLTAILTYHLPNKTGLMVAACAGIAAGYALETLRNQEKHCWTAS